MTPGHPECPRRIDVINDQLQASGVLDFLVQHDAPAATRKQLRRVHTAHHLDWLESRVPDEGLAFIDMDTQMNEKTLSAATFAAGALIHSTNLVLDQVVRNAFCNVRPPGHHASAEQAMGFCFFNNVAVGAAHALEQHGLERVAILDFDVHHGNGTDVIFQDDERVLVCSMFQQDLYPFAGGGAHRAGGIDIPLPSGSGGERMREAVLSAWTPALDAYQPEMIYVSAGFDAHVDDDISGLCFSDADFRWLTRYALDVAQTHAQGRLVSTLEGGYELDSLARCAAAHVRDLAGI
jgi:acetoin utilization deacetylase AcuC-like enzyme